MIATEMTLAALEEDMAVLRYRMRHAVNPYPLLAEHHALALRRIALLRTMQPAGK